MSIVPPRRVSPQDLEMLADKKQVQAQIVALDAASHPDDTAKNRLLLHSAELNSEAERLRQKAKAGDGVLQLRSTLPENEIDRARSKQSVNIDGEYFLPHFRNDCVPLPIIFVRSSLFPGTLSAEKSDFNNLSVLVSWSKDYSIAIHGFHRRLCSFDRTVFAACLLFYRNRPLSSDGDEPVKTTLRKFSEILEIRHGSGVADRIRDSLIRLSTVSVTIENKSGQVELNPLIELDSSESFSRFIRLKIPKRLSILYKEQQWWAIPLSIIKKPGLAGWVGCYYSTHKNWDEVKLEKLQALSGVASEGHDFKVKLVRALTNLGGEDIPTSSRIISYSLERSSSDGAEVAIIKTHAMTGPARRGRASS